MSFRIGQEIYCIEEREAARRNSCRNEKIFKDKIYTVDSTGKNHLFNYVKVNGMVTQWKQSSFRPLDEVLEEIEISEVIEIVNPDKLVKI